MRCYIYIYISLLLFYLFCNEILYICACQACFLHQLPSNEKMPMFSWMTTRRRRYSPRRNRLTKGIERERQREGCDCIILYSFVESVDLFEDRFFVVVNNMLGFIRLRYIWMKKIEVLSIESIVDTFNV